MMCIMAAAKLQFMQAYFRKQPGGDFHAGYSDRRG